MPRRRHVSGPAVERREATERWPALEIRSSARRKKTATAWWEGATLVVALPGHVREPERSELVAWLVERAARRRPSLHRSDPELLARARALAERYLLDVEPTAVRFVTNQRRRWGSCTPETGVIRLSERLRATPDWVLDCVLVHELAHLAHPDHGAAFSELAHRHPRQDEATRYLEGYQLGLDVADEERRSASEALAAEQAPAQATRRPQSPRAGDGELPTLF